MQRAKDEKPMAQMLATCTFGPTHHSKTTARHRKCRATLRHTCLANANRIQRRGPPDCTLESTVEELVPNYCFANTIKEPAQAHTIVLKRGEFR